MLTSKEICVITPTKGRHKLLSKMLESLANQTAQVGQVIIADGGRDAEAVVNSFKDRLPVEWLDCPVAGQIPQRKLALHKIKDDIKVIIYFDDDIYQEPESLRNLIDFWNDQDKQPGGVSFNLLGTSKQKDSFFRQFFNMQLTPKGKVLSSGYNTPIIDMSESIKSEWLLGGATAWRRDILLLTDHSGIATSWAICEDLIFSYPISKKEDLFVCSEARVHDIDRPVALSFSQMRFRGRNSVLWRYYFVSSHKELSIALFFWMNIGQIVSRFVIGISGNKSMLGQGIGHLEGIVKCTFNALFRKDPKDVLE